MKLSILWLIMSNMQFVRHFLEGSLLIQVITDVLCRRQSQFIRQQFWAYNDQFKPLTTILHFWSEHPLRKMYYQKIDIDVLLIVFNICILNKRRPELHREIIIPYMHPTKSSVTVLVLLLAFGILSMMSDTDALPLQLLLFTKEESSTKPLMSSSSLSSFPLSQSVLQSSLSLLSSSSFESSFD